MQNVIDKLKTLQRHFRKQWDDYHGDLVDEIIEQLEDPWRPIEEAPRDGSEVVLFRPLAYKTNDPIIAIRETTDYKVHAWKDTVPQGRDGINYNLGSCYATHYMPLPKPPRESE